MSPIRARLFAIALSFCMGGVIANSAAEDILSRNSDYDYDAPVPGSYSLPVVKTAADGALVDSTGKDVNLRDLTHGRITVLGFIYTRCAAPKACPYATNVFGELQAVTARDKTLAANMRLVSLSFDPEHDTPRRLAEFAEAVRETKSGCEWKFATGRSRAELNVILDAYGQAVDQRPNPDDAQGPLYHVLRVFLIDAKGRIRNIYSAATLDPRLVLADVKTLLLEEPKLSKN
jgi:cytochrome oxidase Cu insertion factor (SCO1/SenC/PrrC family)